METFQAKIVNRTATVQPAAVPTKTVQNRAAAVRSPAPIQMATKVSSPHDPAEKEAEVTARKIMRMTISEGSAAYKSGSGGILFRQIKNQNLPFSITRFSSVTHILAKQKEEILQRKADTQPLVTPKATADIQNSMAGGSPLPPSVRRFMEPRFRADFSQVKVHTSDKAAKLNRQLNARAFTMGNHLFFGKEQFKPESSEGKELIAHELTHTIQQGGVIQRSEEVNVTQQAPVQIQRLGLSDALGYFADKANFIPGFRMLTIILGVNPINMSRVERSAANILRAIVEFIPGGALITQALDNHGIVNKVGQWIEQQIQSLGMTAGVIKQAISKFLDSLSWSDIFNLGNVWELAKRILTEPIDRLINFAKGLITGILQFIKEAILRPLAKLAEGTRGYDLLKAVLGEDPVTGESVPRTADTLIGGFMKLIGQEEVWTNLKQANAVARAWAWFQGALSSLVGLVRQIPSMFIQTVKSLELADVVLIPRAFAKVVGVFGNFIGSFLKWAGDAVWTLLEIIFAVVAPGAIPYLKKAAGAFRSILKNPISFVGNLVQAGKRGFLQFADNIGKYLKTSLIQWLTGTLVGVYLPQSFEIREIIKFVLSVLNLTWQTIRQKLVRVVGERLVTAMETGLDIVVTLVREGPAAVWEKIKEQVTNLKETVIEGITSFVTSKIVQSAVIKIVSMLNPVGAAIQAILTIYDTIMFFIERLKQIAQVTMAFLDSISAIAAGVIAAAANRVEQTLAGLLTLAISFLARFAGLGKVGDAVMNIIRKLQAPIEKALDAVVGWVVGIARKTGKFFIQSGKKIVSKIKNWWGIRKEFQSNDGQRHALYFRGEEDKSVLTIESDPTPYQNFINTVKVDKDKTEIINAKNNALEIAKQIDALKYEKYPTGLNDEQLEQERDKKQKKIEGLIQKLQGHTKFLFGENIPDSKKPEWILGPKGFGKEMYVKPLTNKGKNAKAGSAPHEGHDIYDKILNKRRQQGGASYYIRGHLLNEKLGGPGKWENMTPLSREGNSKHEKEVESKVKAAVNSGAIVEYKVVATYNRTVQTQTNSNSNIKTEDDNQNKENKAKIISDIIENEKYVPTKLKCKASYILDNQKRKTIVEQDVPNPVEQEKDKYHLEGTPKPQPIYLNKKSADKSKLAKAIATVLGISETRVEDTLLNDPKTIFRNYEDVSKSLGNLKSANELRKLRDDGKITLSTKNEEED